MKDAAGHGSDERGGDKSGGAQPTKSFDQIQREKDNEFVSQLRGWFAGDKQAAQTLADRYGSKSAAVEIHSAHAMASFEKAAFGAGSDIVKNTLTNASELGRTTAEAAGGAQKAFPHAPASQSEKGKSSYSPGNKQSGYKLALQDIARRKGL